MNAYCPDLSSLVARGNTRERARNRYIWEEELLVLPVDAFESIVIIEDREFLRGRGSGTEEEEAKAEEAEEGGRSEGRRRVLRFW
jgi:hypothetical protein